MANKKYILVIDTETLYGLDTPVAYDVGGVVTDRNGTIYEKFHFLVKEIWERTEDMQTAYYYEKCKGYYDRLAAGTISLTPFADILRHIYALSDKYNIKTLAAYNLQFDLRAMQNTMQTIFDTPKWQDRRYNYFCILCAACDVLYRPKYIKTVRGENWLTEKGHVKTSAEVGYRYISGNYEFVEEHRGLDDCEIEAEILAACYRRHKKMSAYPRKFPMRQVYARDRADSYYKPATATA